ncbi:phosphotransferase [Novosphingobium indicum]|nr:phosphotransferase [Novosphingobium indicum]
MIEFPGADQNFIDDIERMYEKEQAESELITDIAKIPARYELLTAEWMTKALCASTPGARVETVTLDAPDDGSSNRRRIFLTYNEVGQAAGLPPTVFAKASNEVLNRVIYGILGTGEIESTFYTKIRPELDIEAPKCLFANFDPRTFNSIILLKDMRGEADFCDYDTPITFERAAGMLRLLAGVHAKYAGDKVEAIRPLLRTWPQHWANILRLGMEEYSKRGFLAAETVMPSSLFKRYDEVWPATMAAVAQHEVLPPNMIHGDVHLKNWYITKDGRMGLSDWQGPTLGHWSRDIAYSMSAALSVENRRAWERDLLALYREEMLSLGVEMPSLDEVITLFRRQLFTALAYWTITLRHPPTMPDMQPENATIEFIKRISTAIDDHDAFAAVV